MVYFFKIFVVPVLFSFVFCPQSMLGCSDEDCAFSHVGYRRAGVEAPIIVLNGVPHDFTPYFNAVSRDAAILRTALLGNDALGKPQKKLKKEDSKSTNVASFGFVFFDRKGHQINEQPFHFSPAAAPQTIRHPFFFVSGRCQRECNLEIDPFPWAALPEYAPKQGDLRLRPIPQLYPRGRPPEIADAFKDVLPEVQIGLMGVLKDSMERTHRDFSRYVEPALIEKSKKVPFFDFVHTRYVRLSDDNGMHPHNKTICEQVLPTLDVPITPIKDIYFYPALGDNIRGQNQEGDFTHGEQYALFQMSQNFGPFIDACIQEIVPSAEPEMFVGSYAVLIYTTNAMCVRCAQCTVFDFHCLNEIIKQRLAQSGFASDPLSIFMAGYLNPYASALHDCFKLDAFEEYMRNPDQKSPHLPQLSEQELETKHQTIYHYLIPQAQAGGAGAADDSDPDPAMHEGPQGFEDGMGAMFEENESGAAGVGSAS